MNVFVGMKREKRLRIYNHDYNLINVANFYLKKMFWVPMFDYPKNP